MPCHSSAHFREENMVSKDELNNHQGYNIRVLFFAEHYKHTSQFRHYQPLEEEFSSSSYQTASSSSSVKFMSSDTKTCIL
jgi:hypothetical protein